MEELIQKKEVKRDEFFKLINNVRGAEYDETDFFSSFDFCFKRCVDDKSVGICAKDCIVRYKEMIEYGTSPDVYRKLKKEILRKE